jgi:hypothetical protein
MTGIMPGKRRRIWPTTQFLDLPGRTLAASPRRGRREAVPPGLLRSYSATALAR